MYRSQTTTAALCSTPVPCETKPYFLAVEVGTPGHAFNDLIRSSRYGRASASPNCSTNMTRVVRTTPRARDPSSDWHAYFLEAVFPDARIVHKPLPRNLVGDIHYPKMAEALECCQVCLDTSPYYGLDLPSCTEAKQG